MTRFFLSVLAVLAFCVSCSPSLEDVTEEQTIATKEMNQQSATEPPFNDAPMSCTPAQPSYGANTIEDCYTLSQAARQSYCNYYNYCPAYCIGFGCYGYSGPVAIGCAAQYTVVCMCYCGPY